MVNTVFNYKCCRTTLDLTYKTARARPTNCSRAEAINNVAAELKIDVYVSKETDPEVIMSYGVMSTPAVVVNESLVHCGSVPSRPEIESWLRN